MREGERGERGREGGEREREGGKEERRNQYIMYMQALPDVPLSS